jgi:hypothetical protein
MAGARCARRARGAGFGSRQDLRALAGEHEAGAPSARTAERSAASDRGRSHHPPGLARDRHTVSCGSSAAPCRRQPRLHPPAPSRWRWASPALPRCVQWPLAADTGVDRLAVLPDHGQAVRRLAQRPEDCLPGLGQTRKASGTSGNVGPGSFRPPSAQRQDFASLAAHGHGAAFGEPGPFRRPSSCHDICRDISCK